MASDTPSSALSRLPDTFRFSEALTKISERQLRNLIADGRITSLSRGLYRKATWIGDENLLEIASKAPRSILCLRSALAHHGLIDDIPSAIDVALPRNTWAPSTAAPVSWHRFDPKTFDIGREEMDLAGAATIGIYTPERCLIDAFRLRHREGPDLANGALKRWLRAGGQPSRLLGMARAFPQASTPLRQALEILL